jgi:murein DD-endopeptidase MepM/ murein hydrolase activator NlpD
MFWQKIIHSDLALKTGIGILGALIVLGGVWGLSGANLSLAGAEQIGATGSVQPTAVISPELPPLAGAAALAYAGGIPRLARLHTTLPDRPRFDVIQYTVQKGDTIFGIAEKFGLDPSSILWANLYVLGDNPHNLSPGQVLNILPVDGVYYRWSAGDGLNGVAKFFGVSPDDIVDFPGNHLTRQSVGDYSHPNIPVGTWLIIPNGRREFISWSAPQIPRSNPAVARLFGPGYCGKVAYGVNGTGSFVWPTVEHWISGYDYSPAANHPAIDIAGQLGNAVYAADSGVVVYAGWNDWGYGNVIVIDHGNGWQTLYAHLSQVRVGCGQSVNQGELIGNVGSTGNSSGPHLHFEMMLNGTKQNPHAYLP